MNESYNPSLRAKINSFVNGIKDSKLIFISLTLDEGFDLCEFLKGQLNIFYKLTGDLSIEDNINSLSIISEEMITWINELNYKREPNYKNKIEGIWKFHDYLINKKKELSDATHVSTLGNKKLEKQITIIFKNKYAYEMFLKLKELTIKGAKYETANYAFIFHKMVKLKYINKVKHEVFMKFLNDFHDTHITNEKFPFKNPQNKQALFASVLKDFQSKIETEP